MPRFASFRRCLLLALVWLTVDSSLLAADPPEPKKIVLIAGKKSHGPEGNGIHDYPWSVKLLKVMLDNSNVRDRVAVEYHLEGWPRDPATLDTADTIMVISDGRDGDLYEEAPHFRDPANVALIERQMRRGCGFLTFHFSTFAPDKYARQILDWSGGYFDWETDGKRQWYSAIRTLDTDVRLATPEHPVASGVKPFKLREEFYYNLRFGDGDQGFKPLLSVPALGGREPDGNVVAWARERADGGRGFGTTCGHFYDNWRNDDFRRLILNAIAWTAKVEVPKEGVAARYYERDEIVAALDGKEGTARATVDARPIRVLIVAGNAAHKWHNWEKTTVAIKQLLEVDPRIVVDVSYDIEDLATKKLSDYQVLVQNYANWHDPRGISEAARGAFLGFLRQGGGLVLVHFANGAFNFSLPMAGESDWPEYRKIVRRVWNHHGQGEAKSGHDAFGPFTVKPTEVKHPISEGLQEFGVTDELYFRQDGDQPIEPLIQARSKVTGRDEPLAWTYTYGEAKVFQTLLGHSEKTYDTFEPCEMLRRAVAWTAGRAIVKRNAPPGEAKPKPAAAPAVPAAPKPTKISLTAGKFGQALDARQAGVVVAAKSVQRDAPLTVECWAKIDDKNVFQILLASEPKSSPTHWELYSYAGSGVLSVYMPGRGGEYRSDANVCDGQWHHLSMALEAARVRLAVDGRTVLDRPVTGTTEKSKDGDLAIGRLVEGGIGCAGSIDEVRIRRGAALADKIPTEGATVDADTVGLWKFDELADDGTAPDASSAKLPARLATDGAAGPGAGGSKPNRPIVAARPDHWGVESVGFNWTEADSRDDRWSQTELGVFLASSLPLPGKPLRKGLSIRVGDPPLATVAFDTESLKWRAAWTGGFLAFDPARYGIISPPRPAGPPLYAMNEGLGWDAEAASPAESGQYVGLRLHGRRVLVEYRIGDVRVRESPWAEKIGDMPTTTRTVEVSESRKPLRLNHFDLADGVRAELSAEGAWKIARRPQGDRWLVAALRGEGCEWRSTAANVQLAIEPGADERRAKVWTASLAPDQIDAWLKGLAVAPAVESLVPLTQPGPARWTQEIVTRGERGADVGAYVLDTIPLPHDNPYKALLFVGGHDFLPNGDAVICTVHGDLWRASGVNDKLEKIVWKRMATGLFQPLGLQVVEGRVHVLGRDQITELIDHDGDGEMDEYRCVNNRTFTSYGGHDYVTCLEYDGTEWFYFMHATQGLVRASRDGRKYETIATGFRNPNGMGRGPRGELTASPQEGEWVPGSNIALVKAGGYYGYGGPKVTAERPLGYDPPLCWIPRMVDNSSGGQTWVTSDRWGPLSGQLLHFSFGKCRMLLVPHEQIGGQTQGGTVAFPFTFLSGAHRGRFSPHDGQLYVSGLKGWVTSAVQDGSLQRVRYTGRPVDLPLRVITLANGLAITFGRALERATAEDPENYDVQQWNYRYAAAYGSSDWKVSDPRQEGHDPVEVRSATLLDDGATVFLEFEHLAPAHQFVIDYSLRAADGTAVQNTLNYTIHATSAERMDAARLKRPAPAGGLAPEQVARLRPGLRAEVRQGERRASETVRLAALSAATDEAPLTELAAAAFHAQFTGYLLAPLRGEYEFRLEGAGAARLQIAGGEAARLPASSPSSIGASKVTLHKGPNRFELTYETPTNADAQMRVLWRGKGFSWEPIPSTALAHLPAASRDDSLVGNVHDETPGWFLAGRHQCLRCHGDLAVIDANRGKRRASAPSGPPLLDWQGRRAPSLAGAGSRWTTAWLAAWIAAPEHVRPEARMPKLLDAADPAQRQEIADLAAYLATLREAGGDSQGVDRKAGDGEAGKSGLALYEDLGCASCHRLTDEPAEGEPTPPRISLARVSQKFTSGRIAQFLRQPRAHDAWRRMPDFRLNVSEAAALEAWLRAPEGIEPAATLPEAAAGNAERGRAAFQTRGCANCHAVETAPGVASVAVASAVPPIKNAESGCLAAADAQRGRAPRFQLSVGERRALADWVRAGLTRPASPGALDGARHFMSELRCEACHSRDGRTSPRGLLLAEEGLRGLPPEVLPNLSWSGDKLRTPYLERLLTGGESTAARPWLKARMPGFGGYASWLARGLAAEHGWLRQDLQQFGVPVTTAPSSASHRELAALGDQLTQKEMLDCRQCHAVGRDQPRGDAATQIALGVNFQLVRERVREDYFSRFVLNPPRYDVGTKMPVLALDGRTTRVTQVFDGDAAKQFAAIWALIQSQPLREDGTPKK